MSLRTNIETDITDSTSNTTVVALRLLESLQEVFLWLVTEHVPVSVIPKKSRVEDSEHGRAIETMVISGYPIATENVGLPSGGLYNVNIAEWETYRRFADVEVRYKRADSATVIMFDSLAKVGDIDDHLYEYPPRSIESLMFFLLNPALDAAVEKVVRRNIDSGVISSEEFRKMVELWSYTRDQVSGLFVTKVPDISSSDDYLDYLVTSTVRLENMPGLHRFVGAATVIFISDSFDVINMYILCLKEGEKYFKYYVEDEQSFEDLVTHMVPQQERAIVIRELSKTVERIMSIPVVTKSIKTIEPGWFKKKRI